MRTLLLFLLLLLSVSTIYTVQAQDAIESNEYKIQLDDIRYDEPTPIPHIEATDSILYGTDKATFEKQGYLIKHHLPYDKTESSLSMSVSQTRVGFDPQPMDAVAEKNITMSVSSESVYSYQVLAVQQKPISSVGGGSIENTKCNPDLQCTVTLARAWDKSGVYGFGYRLSGDDVPFDFHDGKKYRSFPLNSKTEDPVILLQNQNTSGTKQIQAYFKLVYPPAFQEGTYTGDITLFALPKL